ncbi:MAG: hypothetical protein V2I63_08140 [Pseudomonadales bacterium]|nr:hypothetical protein [Pseudomonadales bacterium]
MLAALLLSYLLGGSGVAFGGLVTTPVLEDISARVSAAVDDPARAAEASRLLEELEREVARFEKAYLKSEDKLTKHYKTPESTEARMLAVLDDLERRWGRAQDEGVRVRFALKDLLTPDEWARVFPQD